MRNDRIGKSEARERLLPLIQQVSTRTGPIEITDRGKVKAVLMGYKEYLHLLALARMQPTPTRSPVGTLEILGDLEEASREISRAALEAVLRSADEL